MEEPLTEAANPTEAGTRASAEADIRTPTLAAGGTRASAEADIRTPALAAGGRSSFSGSGHAYASSRGWGQVSSGRTSGGSQANLGGFSSRLSGNFGRNSAFGGGSYGSSAASRNFGRSEVSQAAARSSRSFMGERQSFGNSTGRSISVSARTPGNAIGGGWHSFGNLSRGEGAEMARGYGSYAEGGSQWRSFGNSRNASLGANVSGVSSSGTSRAAASNAQGARLGFSSDHFSTNMPGSSRLSSFSSFPSFSSGRSMGNFGSAPFAASGLGSSDFGNSAFGGSSFSNSFIGSNLSLIPNLLFGGLLRLGTSVLGGWGILGETALSLAARSLGFGLGSNGFGQGGFAGGDFGLGRGGFGWSSGFDQDPVWPVCGAGASFWRPGWAGSGYCGSYPYYSSGWSGIGYFADPRTGYNIPDDSSAN